VNSQIFECYNRM